MDACVVLWNDLCPPVLAKVARLTEPRRQKLAKRLTEDFGNDPDRWAAYLRRILRSPFLTGETSRDGWRADFDFAIEARNAVKIMEGRYDPRPGNGGARPGWNPGDL